jgi:exodeoxyribonuclease VII small subunit
MEQAAELTFEQALLKLEEIVQELDSGELSLEEAIRRFEEGMALKALCAERLASAEAKVEVYVEGPEE